MKITNQVNFSRCDIGRGGRTRCHFNIDYKNREQIEILFLRVTMYLQKKDPSCLQDQLQGNKTVLPIWFQDFESFSLKLNFLDLRF